MVFSLDGSLHPASHILCPWATPVDSMLHSWLRWRPERFLENPKATRPNHHRLCLGASVPAGRVASREVEHVDRDTALSLPVSQWSFGCWAYGRPQDPAGWPEGTLGTWLILFSRARLACLPCVMARTEQSRTRHTTQRLAARVDSSSCRRPQPSSLGRPHMLYSAACWAPPVA